MIYLDYRYEFSFPASSISNISTNKGLTEGLVLFPGSASGKELTCQCRLDRRHTGSIPGLGRSPGEGNGNPLQRSCLEDPGDRGAWWAIVHTVAQSWTQLKQRSTHTHTHSIFTELCNYWYCLILEHYYCPSMGSCSH